jgi:hypothetical protein
VHALMTPSMALSVAIAGLEVQRREMHLRSATASLSRPKRRPSHRTRSSEWRRAMRRLDAARERLALLQAESA